jgi:hypothetical protein
MNFACNPDESAGYSEKVHRYVAYECWGDVSVELAECDTAPALGTMLVTLAEDRWEIGSPAKVVAVYDRQARRWITGTPFEVVPV